MICVLSCEKRFGSVWVTVPNPQLGHVLSIGKPASW